MKFSAAEKSLFNKNKKALLKLYPGLASILDQEFPSNIDLYRQDDEIDVLINGKRFYGIDYREFANRQIETFVATPSYGAGGKPEATEDRTPTHVKLFNKFESALKRAGVTRFEDRIHPDASTAFVFGLGLAAHLAPIFIETQCRFMVIFEPEPVFLKLSLYFSDWKQILKLSHDRIFFFFQNTPEAAFSDARIILRSRNIGIQILVYKYQHYVSIETSAIRKYFDDKIHTLYDGLGFYDDEKVMLRNHLLNAYGETWKLCTQAKRGHLTSAVVVGAGPSLNKDIEWLKKNKDNLIIFSGGSALPTLLSNDIVPDFHVEIENIALNYELLKPLSDQYDLSNVVLVCSSTMDTASSRLFKRRLWFMREGVMISQVFTPGQETLIWQNPTVVNTALSAALGFGFRNVLLLGADFGTRDPRIHHSKGTAYESHEELKKVEFKFPDKIPANFGGGAYTNIHYINGILTIDLLLKNYRQARVFNGSDGAYVQGCQPVPSSRFKFAQPTISKGALRDLIYEAAGNVDWSEKYQIDLIEYLEKDFEEYMELNLKMLKKTLVKNRKDFFIFLSELYVAFNQVPNKYAVYNPMLNGSINSFTMLQMYYWSRVSRDDREKYEVICRRQWRMFFDLIRRDFLRFVQQVRQELPLVRPELFDDKGTLIVEANPGVQNAK